MKRTYTVEIEFPGNISVEDWKVQNMVASQIENAKIRMVATGEVVNLKVKQIELVEETKEDPIAAFTDELVKLFTIK